MDGRKDNIILYFIIFIDVCDCVAYFESVLSLLVHK